jgi:hypothetical protein
MDPDRDVADLQEDHLLARSNFGKRNRDLTDGETGIEPESRDGSITKKKFAKKRYIQNSKMAGLIPSELFWPRCILSL